jgi:hypothetical protein
MKELGKLVKRLKDRTYMNKTLKIELHVPEEQKDKNVFVEPTVTSSVPEKQSAQAQPAPTEHSTSADSLPARAVAAPPHTPELQHRPERTEDSK